MWLRRQVPTAVSSSTITTLDALAAHGPLRISRPRRARGDQPARHDQPGQPARGRRAGRARPRPDRRARRARPHHRGRPGAARPAPRRAGRSCSSANSRDLDDADRAALAAAVPAIAPSDHPHQRKCFHVSSHTAVQSPFKQPKAVWAVAFACVISFMGIGLVDPILASLSSKLHATPSQVELLFTSYLVVTAVAMLVTGWVSSRIGAKRTLIAGLVLIVVFAALAGSSGQHRRHRRLPRRLGPGQRAVHRHLARGDRQLGERRLRRRDHPVRDRARRRHRARARCSAACSARSAGAARSTASRC